MSVRSVAVRITCPALLAAIATCVAAGEPGGAPAAEHPFGLHGPQYSHWLHAERPNLWLEGQARFAVLAGTGAGWARQDFWWSLVEPQQGTFVWDDFDRAVASYERHGIKLFAILCYSSAWSGGVCPDTDAERERFANYVFKMVERYKGRVAAWEIWNEPNIQPFWSPLPDPELYAQLLRAAYAAAKKADPDSVIVGGSLAGPDYDFLDKVYQHGARGTFDVLSYHNYGQELDITREWSAVHRLREVMRRHGDGDKPIWHTETGFYTGPVGLTEHEQAARIVRYSVGLLGLGIKKTFQLTLNDWTDDPQHHDLSSYRGLTHADYRVKESYAAYQTMCRRLSDKRFVAALRPAPGVLGLLFVSEIDDAVLVLWRDWGEQPKAAQLDLDVPVALVQQLNGDWQIHRNTSGVYDLAVGADPVYVLNSGPAITNQRYVRWPNPVSSRLPRAKGAVLEVEVSNPVDRPMELAIYPRKGSSSRLAAADIAPGATASVPAAVDASGLDVGAHELFWTLSAGGGAEPVAQGFRAVQVESLLRLAFGRFNRLRSAKPTLPARIEYHGVEPVTASAALRLDGAPSGDPVTVELEPGRSASVDLPLNLAAFADGRTVPIELAVEAGDAKLTARCRRPLVSSPSAPPQANIDGRLDEWIGHPPQIRPPQMYWEYINATARPGPDDLAVTAWVAYDERGLWLAVRVQGDAAVYPQSRAIWNWDSLQVGLDLGGDAQPDKSYDGNDLEIELGFGPDGKPWCYLGYCPTGWPLEQLSAKLVGAVRPSAEGGYTDYELLIPAALLVSSTTLEAETVIGFSLLVNDNDGAGRAGWQELTSGIGLGKAPAKFAWLWFR
ncbi:MAG: hypothetical protein GY778_04070 [bacterium]|nr:hypothetical protein [bacterium]